MNEALQKIKEDLKRKKEKLEKEKNDNYAKNYYKDFSKAGKGIPMVGVITDDHRYIYIPKGPVDDTYDLAASMISGITGETISRDKIIDELSSEYNYIIINAAPTTTNEPTTIYVPEQLSEFQQVELSNFEKQIEDHNKKYGDKVEIKKIVTIGKNIDDMSILK